MAVITLTKDNFKAEILEAQGPVLVDFWASWCGPCKMLSPVVDEIAEEHPEIKVCKVNVDDEGEIAEAYGIMSIPTLIVFRNGEAVNRKSGVMPKAAILAMVQ